jgi:hypothetical protein
VVKLRDLRVIRAGRKRRLAAGMARRAGRSEEKINIEIRKK